MHLSVLWHGVLLLTEKTDFPTLSFTSSEIPNLLI